MNLLELIFQNNVILRWKEHSQLSVCWLRCWVNFLDTWNCERIVKHTHELLDTQALKSTRTKWANIFKWTCHINIPMHSRRPSPLHTMHFGAESWALPPLPNLSFPFISLEGSSHLFSPRRNTLCWNISVSAGSLCKTVCWPSLTLIGAPFDPSFHHETYTDTLSLFVHEHQKTTRNDSLFYSSHE